MQHIGIKYSTTANTTATTANWWQLQIRSEATVRILGRGLNEGLRHLQSGEWSAKLET